MATQGPLNSITKRIIDDAEKRCEKSAQRVLMLRSICKGIEMQATRSLDAYLEAQANELPGAIDLAWAKMTRWVTVLHELRAYLSELESRHPVPHDRA